MVVYRYGQVALGLVLTDDVLIEKLVDIAWGKFLGFAWKKCGLVAIFFGFAYDFIRMTHTAIANMGVDARDEHSCFVLLFAAKRTI